MATVTLMALTGFTSTSLADDHERLEAALKRIEALEAKMARFSEVEAENKQLKARLQKAEKVEGPQHRSIAIPATGNTTQHAPQEIPFSVAEIAQGARQKWQGFYAGINTGYGANVNNRRLQSGDYFSTSDAYFAGGIVGVQAGYNEVLENNVVLGVETEANYANIYDFNNSYNNSTLGSTYDYSQPDWWRNNRFITYYNSQYSQTALETFGTTRLRLGYALGNFMPYLTGGAAYGMVSHETRDQYISSQFPASSGSTYNTSVAAGWAAGGGFEYLLADNWSTKFEYLYTSIGQIRFENHNESYEFFGVNQARMGLNYHFDISGN